MALSPIEDSYLQRLTSSQFPDMPASEPAMPVDAAALDAPSMDGMQLAAGPSQTVSDAGPSIGPIPRNTFQAAVGKLGELIQSGAEKIDFDVIGLPGVGSMTLKDLTVGDLGKVLQDMSYGFMPVRGGNVATGGIGTFGLKADPVMELLNAAPAVVSVAKGAVKAAKATKGMPVGMSTEAVGGIEKALIPQQALKSVNVGDKVDGRTVLDGVPNMSSIGASLDEYTIVEGIKEIPLSAFDNEYVSSIKAENLDKRTKELAAAIKKSKQITPLIVVADSKGFYVLEGGHRFDALIASKAKSLPAVVVIDESDKPSEAVLKGLK